MPQIIIEPPINPYMEILSLTKMNTQIGPKTDSESIIIPTVADGVVLNNCNKYKTKADLKTC